MFTINKITNSSEETNDYAKSISFLFKKGGIYGLKGELGSGKTTFIKGLLKGMGYKDMVNSPTFTLINEYDAEEKVIHMDCYREQNIKRWIDLGIFEYFSSNSIILIEWPDVISKILPKRIRYINFSIISEGTRKIILT